MSDDEEYNKGAEVHKLINFYESIEVKKKFLLVVVQTPLTFVGVCISYCLTDSPLNVHCIIL